MPPVLSFHLDTIFEGLGTGIRWKIFLNPRSCFSGSSAKDSCCGEGPGSQTPHMTSAQDLVSQVLCSNFRVLGLCPMYNRGLRFWIPPLRSWMSCLKSHHWVRFRVLGPTIRVPGVTSEMGSGFWVLPKVPGLGPTFLIYLFPIVLVFPLLTFK